MSTPDIGLANWTVNAVVHQTKRANRLRCRTGCHHERDIAVKTVNRVVPRMGPGSGPHHFAVFSP
jgi:hypothetical protein